MELVARMQEARADVLRDAADALRRAHLQHYDDAGEAESERRLDHLLGLVIECLRQRALSPIAQYGATVAKERYHAGFDIAEVQTAFNVLEEAIWHVVVPALPEDELATAVGMIGAVLGAGKDALARTWVSLASRHHVGSLDVNALFDGLSG